MQYRGTEKAPTEIGAELDVEALVAGTIRWSGEKVRITAEVFEASTGALLWSDAVEGDERDLLRLQGQLTQAIADGMRIDLSTEEIARLTHEQVVDPALYNEYLKGVYFIGNDVSKANVHFERAIDIDSTYAPAWAGLAEYHIRMAHMWPPPADVIENARETVDRALALDPNLPEALYTDAHIAWEHEWRMEAAVKSFDRALALKPSNGYGQIIYAYFCTANRMFEQGAEAARRAVEVDPLNNLINMTAWFNLACAGYEDEAKEVVRHAQELVPGFDDTYSRIAIPFVAENYEDVLALPDEENPMAQLNLLGHKIMVHLELGDTASAKELAEIVGPPREGDIPINYAIYYAWSGDHDKAFEYLDQVVNAGGIFATRLIWSWYFKPLYGDPRWDAIIKQVGFLVEA